MDRYAIHLQRLLNQACSDVLSGLPRMYSTCDVRPRPGTSVFQIHDNPDAADDEIWFKFGPIVFLLPERATHRECSLYVSVEGLLAFEKRDRKETPRTKAFGTKIGYFRIHKGQPAEHVYGAHYDIDDNSFGHPVFHSQISAQMDLLTSVNELYRIDLTAEDKVGPILKNVRTPTAQMDVFSVITQLCADHLIYEHSTKEVQKAFSDLLAATDFFVGAACRMPHLNSASASTCYRSTHWYARNTVILPSKT